MIGALRIAIDKLGQNNDEQKGRIGMTPINNREREFRSTFFFKIDHNRLISMFIKHSLPHDAMYNKISSHSC